MPHEGMPGAVEKTKQEKIEEIQSIIKNIEDKIFTEEKAAEVIEMPLDNNSSLRKVSEAEKEAAKLHREIAGVYKNELKKQQQALANHQNSN